MVFPWLFDEIHALRPFKEAAELLAKKKDWAPLYDIATLNNNKVFHMLLTCLRFNSSHLYIWLFNTFYE